MPTGSFFSRRLDGKSRMSREVHVRIREGVGVRFPRATRLIVGFQYRREAERFLADLHERFVRFGLELHQDKTRVLEFGRFAQDNRSRRKEGKPETFNFLGFTHICGLTRKGKFTVLRKTMRTRRQAKLKEVYQELKRRMHDAIPEQGAYLRAVVGGHIRYYGVPMNVLPYRGSVRRSAGCGGKP